MEENRLQIAKLKKERLRKSLAKAKSQASDILSFTLSFKDLERHFDSIELDLNKKSRALETKENDLEERSRELETKRRILEKRAREIDSADGFRREAEMKNKILDSLSRAVESQQKKLLTANRLLYDRKIELKRIREASQSKKVDDSKDWRYKTTLEEQQDKYEEVLEKTRSERARQRALTADAEDKEAQLRYANSKLDKRRGDLERANRKLHLLRQNIKDAEKKLNEKRRGQRVTKGEERISKRELM
ncbi:unnamed protein product [Cochlearia groenlandica]